MPHKVFYASVDSSKVVEPVVQVIQSTKSDSDSEIECEQQEAVASRVKVYNCCFTSVKV